MDRDDALDCVAAILDAVETDLLPVPVREVWVYGDVALGLDPIERLNVYVTKDLLLRDAPDREAEFVDSHGVRGVGKTVRAAWADRYPDSLRANDSGHAAPEHCLAAHLLPDDVPVHLEVCNASFDDNVVQRLKGAMARDAYEEILDPRGVRLWLDDAPAEDRDPDERRGVRAEESMAKLRGGELPFPTLPGALEMLGLDEATAREAAEAMRAHRDAQTGATVRGDVV